MHDKVVQHILMSDMTTTSIFGKIISTLSVPTEIQKKEAFLENLTPSHKQAPFHLFNTEELDILFKNGSFIRASKNCILVHAEEKTPACFVVLKGAVQSRIVQNGKAARLSTIGPGTLFASVACVDQKASFTVTFTTCEAAILFKLPEPALALMKKNHPGLWFRLFDLICCSLIALEKSVDKLDVRLGVEAYNRKPDK